MTLEHTARHEAGHAVVAHVLGVRVHAVTIEPADGNLGKVTHAGTIDEATIEAMRELAPHQFVEFQSIRRGVAIAVAGALAAGDMAGCGPDFAHAQRLAMNAHGGDERLGEAFLAYCAKFADTIVQGHQRQVGAVAAALLERKTLTGDEFREVLAAASEAPA